jgi:hypothetical protein
MSRTAMSGPGVIQNIVVRTDQNFSITGKREAKNQLLLISVLTSERRLFSQTPRSSLVQQQIKIASAPFHNKDFFAPLFVMVL